MKMEKKDIISALDSIKAHNSKKSIVEEGHVQNIQIFGDEVEVDAFCPSAALAVKKKLEVDILKAIHEKVYEKAKIKVRLKVPEKPPQADQIKGPALPGVKNIIAVASGKGGVGKSTVTANLAVTLAEMGFQVGLVDADIYGPSMPLMFDVTHEKPGSIEVDGVRKMDPVQNYGVKLRSIGFFAGANQAVVWRGPMATKALNQLIRDAHWGDLDFLIVDLPPGTGDIHLSLVQAVPVTGAVVVSTPQPIALADARKGVAMFNMDSIQVPVLGLVENMSHFIPPDMPDKKYYIFGENGVKNLTQEIDVPFLGEIPLVQSIREAGDVGRPAAMQENTPVSIAFNEMTKRVVEELVRRNDQLPPTEAVRITNMAGCSAVNKK
jgi:ATP-binding protein involved in chromosome partitioning